MAKMTCEMCGSQIFKKENDMVVCTGCGMQYSKEDAKKLLSGNASTEIIPAPAAQTPAAPTTVKLDQTESLEKNLINARRSLRLEDWDNTEKFYQSVLEQDPTNYEAVFYNAYAKVKKTLITPDIFQRQAGFKILNNAVISLIDIFSLEQETTHQEILKQISIDIMSMANSDFVYTITIYTDLITEDDSHKTIKLYNELSWNYIAVLENLATKYPDGQAQKKIFYYQLAVEQCDFIMSRNCQISYWDVRRKKENLQDLILKAQDPVAYEKKKKEQAAKAMQSKATKTKLAIISLILGLVSIATCFTPYAQWFLPLCTSCAGLPLGIVGTGGKKVFAILGIVFSGIGLIAYFVTFFMLIWNI